MAIIEQKIRLVGSKGRREVVALFDSGATYSCVRADLARQLERVVPIPGAMTFSTARKGETLTARERISVNFYINGFRLSDEFMVIPGLTEQVIIGAATMQKWRMKLDFEHDRVIIDPRVTKLRLLGLGSRQSAVGNVTAVSRERISSAPVLPPAAD
jgi:hypothetical protein